MHQLEVALEASHRLHSNECHPLLKEEYRLVANPLDSAAAEPEQATKQELAEGLGTLTIDDHGFRYFGATGSFAVCVVLSSHRHSYLIFLGNVEGACPCQPVQIRADLYRMIMKKGLKIH